MTEEELIAIEENIIATPPHKRSDARTIVTLIAEVRRLQRAAQQLREENSRLKAQAAKLLFSQKTEEQVSAQARSQEREECAKLVEGWGSLHKSTECEPCNTLLWAAAAIRVRGDKATRDQSGNEIPFKDEGPIAVGPIDLTPEDAKNLGIDSKSAK